MRKRIAGVLVLVIGLIIFGGAVHLTDQWRHQNNADSSATETESDGSSAPRQASVDLSIWRLERGETVSISIDVIVSIYGYSERDIHHENVMLCLYGENGSLLDGKQVGTVSNRDGGSDGVGERITVNVTTRKVPSYITVDHPDFRSGGVISPPVLEWLEDDEIYSPTMQTANESLEQFGFPRSSEPGQCG